MESSTVTYQEYETFEILVGAKTATGYPVTVIRSLAGEATATSDLDPSAPNLQTFLQCLETGNVDNSLLVEIGSYLFETIFPSQVAAIYRKSLGRARAQKRGLRLRLRLEAPELAVLPWEYLYDCEEDCFLSLSPETPLVRYVSMPCPSRPIAARPPLRVLVVLSNPVDTSPLDIQQEKNLIKEAVAQLVERQMMKLQFIERGRMAEINQAMRTLRPHAFHFVGHGHYEEDEAHVIFEDEQGHAQLVGARTFREIFLGIAETRLVILNACQLAMTSSSQLLTGLAPELLRRNLSAVVAMQSSISERAALVFAREFYRSLALGYPVDGAMAEARKGILLDAGVEKQAWGTPVLFLRAQDGQLFEVTKEKEIKPEVPPPPEPIAPPLTCGFVGRQTELTYFGDKLKNCQIAGITGMPGVGKTSLASVLVRQTGQYGKIFWHTLHEGESIEEVMWSLAGFLHWQGKRDLWRTLQGARQGGGQLPPPTVLFDYLFQELHGQGFVLCLDNLHCVEDDPLTPHFLRRMDKAIYSGDVLVVATSQHVPASFPADEFQELKGLGLQDAASLFAEYGVPITRAEEGKVYRTDELHRIENLMSPDALATLHDRTGGNPTFLILALNSLKRAPSPLALISHLSMVDDVERFLMAEIDGRLTEEEQAVMSAIAILLGYSGSRGAIEAILEGENVRRVLRELRRRNLLNTREDENGRKYKLNSVVRYYFYDSLSRRERRMMHQRAGEYYELQEPELLKAAAHYERAEDPQKAIQLITDNVMDFISQGRVRFLRRLLERLEATRLDNEQQALLNIAKGRVLQFLGDSEGAVDLYEQALTAAYRVGDQRLEAAILGRLGNAFHSLGQNHRAIALHQEALNIARACDDRREESIQLSELGMAHHALGQIEQAIELFQEAVTIAQEIGDRQWEWHNLTNLGRAHQAIGQLQQAIHLYQEALSISRETRDHWGEGWNLLNLGNAYCAQGKMAPAVDSFQKALANAQATSYRRREGIALGHLGLVRCSLGRIAEAIEFFDRALAIARSIGDRWNECQWTSDRGAALYILGQTDRAIEFYERSLSIARGISDRRAEGIALGHLGQAFSALGQAGQAQSHLEESVTCARETGYRKGEGLGLLELCRLMVESGEVQRARSYCTQALALDMPETAHIGSLLSGIVGLHEHGPLTKEAFVDAIARCRALLDETEDLYQVRYALATALVGDAVCSPNWGVANQRAELLAPALTEYHRAIETCAAAGIMEEAIRNLDLIRASGIAHLEPALTLLRANQEGSAWNEG